MKVGPAKSSKSEQSIFFFSQPKTCEISVVIYVNFGTILRWKVASCHGWKGLRGALK